MKVLKVIPFTYLPISQEQELHYFTDDENIQKYNVVLLKMRGDDTLGIVSDLTDLSSAKIYLKKFYDYKLKPIEKVISGQQFLSDVTYKVLGLIEFIWLQPRSILVQDFFPKFLFKEEKKNRNFKLKSKLTGLSSIVNLDANKTKNFLEVKNRINSQLKKNKNILCVFAQVSALEYYLPFFEKYFKDKFKVCLRVNKSEFRNVIELILKPTTKPLIFLTIRDLLLYPISNLGGIYVFEEENPNYEKKTDKPHFNIKKTARLLSELIQCDYQELSMTVPSFDSYFLDKETAEAIIKKSDFKRLEILDLAQVFTKKKLVGYFHPQVIESIKHILKNNGRIIVLQNRRGYAVFTKCLDCGYIFRCKNCDIPLKLHKEARVLFCHYCNFKRSIPDMCDNCRGFELQTLGTGVEKIKESLKSLLTDLQPTFFEVDLDTIRLNTAKLKFIKNINDSRKSITVGTTSLLDFRFQDFDLALIANIDLFFNFPGYERTMETLRIIGSLYKISKKLIVQTYGDSIDFLEKVKNNLLGIYEDEDEFRKKFYWPPYVDLTKLTYSLSDKQKAFSRSILERDKIQYLLHQYPQSIQKKFQIFGPNEDIIFKRKGKYHYLIIIKSSKELRPVKNEVLRKVNPGFEIEVET